MYLPVATLSILRLRSCSFDSFGFITVSEQILFINENRISAIDAARSRPRSFSSWDIICSSIFSSFSLSFNNFNISSSPSISLLAANLIGMPASSAWSPIRFIIPCRHLCTAPPFAVLSQKSISIGRSR